MTIFQKLNLIINSFFKWSPGKIYIIPNWNGIKLLLLFLFVLTVGLIYANNYLLFFSFLIFFILMFSIISTHSSIQSLDTVIIIPKSFFASEECFFTLTINFKHTVSPIKLNFNLISPLIENRAICHELKNNLNVFPLQVHSKHRGIVTDSHLKVETSHPFGWFKCFKIIKVPTEFYIYPARFNSGTSIALKEVELLNEDNFDLEVKSYFPGESPNRVIWKKNYLNPLLVKVMKNEDQPSFYIDLDLCQTESDLSSVCNFLLSNFTQSNSFFIKVKGEVRSGSGSFFLKQCLEELAVYEI